MKSSNNSAPIEQTDAKPVDTSAEHVRHLEDELLKLKIENAYLKELRMLRLNPLEYLSVLCNGSNKHHIF